MGFTRRPSGGEGDPEPDPLSPYSSPTVRRTPDRGGTEPLDDGGSGAARPSGTAVDGADFATRNFARRQRQSSARVYPQRFGEMARKVDNRQIFLAAGGIIALLVALLAYRAYRNTDPVVDDATTPSGGEAQQVEPTLDLGEAPAGAFVTVAPLGLVEPTAPPAVSGGGGAFVVAGTGTEGLFLRPAASLDGAPLGTLPEGTRVEALGEEINDGARTWKKVSTPQGEGWVAADFLVAAP